MDKVSGGCLIVSKVLLILMLLLIGTEIFLRNVANRSTMIADEYSGYMFCWLTLFAFIYAARHDEFIRVGFAVDRLKGANRELVGLAAALASFLLSAVVCYATFELAWTSYRFHGTSSNYSQTPLVIPQMAMPLAFLLLCVIYLAEMAARLRRMRELRRETAGAAR